MSRPLTRALACLAVPLGALALASPAAAAGRQAAAPPKGLHQLTAVGSLFANKGVGEVDVFNPDGTTEVLTPDSLGLGTGSEEIGFGESVAVDDLDGDGRPDLVVGAPQADDKAGRVWILFNSADGFNAGQNTAGKVHEILGLNPRTAGDLQGAAVAISPLAGGGHEIWVGAPGFADGRASAAGALFHLRLTATGAIDNAASLGPVTQSTAGVPGTSEIGDFLGIELASTASGVIAGMPYEGISRSDDEAGAVLRLRLADDGTVTGQSINQNSSGVPGTAERGDHFGWAVTAGGLAVGVPDEDLGTTKDAGSVQTFAAAADGTLTAGPALTQDSAGIPGTAEKNDAFGTTLALGSFSCAGVTQLAVGSPGEAIGSQGSAGTVAVTTPPGTTGTCATSSLTQGSALPGKAEAGDGTGGALGVVPGDTNATSLDQLLIGVPGESVGAAGSTGRVLAWVPGGTTTSFGFPGGDQTDGNFGETLAAPLSGSAQS